MTQRHHRMRLRSVEILSESCSNGFLPRSGRGGWSHYFSESDQRSGIRELNIDVVNHGFIAYRFHGCCSFVLRKINGFDLSPLG